ncbi:hypothetical protein D3C87_1377820 [compost metagenome]
MCAGKRLRRCAVSASRRSCSSASGSRGTTYPTNWRLVGPSRSMTNASRTPSCSIRQASISPSSIRNPRIFTCWSMRPRYSTTPSARNRARSPLRYSRAPGTKGSGTKRSAVRSGRWWYPRATPSPPRYNSPATPTGNGCKPPSRMYALRLPTGRPIGMNAESNSVSGYASQISGVITVSVGP